MDARRRFGQALDLQAGVGEVLRELLGSIDELALTFEQESIHQRRLIAVMVERTGSQPLASGAKPVDAYQDLLARLDRAVHSSASLAEAVGLRDEAVALLSWLFLPPGARYQELAGLAARRGPSSDDGAAVEALLAAPGHLEYFLARIDDPAWLDLLEPSGILEPPGGQSAWPVYAAVGRLRVQHAGHLSALLSRMLGRWEADPGKSSAIARAALMLGADGQDAILRALRRHRGAQDLWWAAAEAARQANPASDFVEQVADVVLSAAIQQDSGAYLRPLLEAYVEGVTAENLAGRIQLLCLKLRATPQADHHRRGLASIRNGSVVDPPAFGEDHVFPSLVRALVEALRKAAGNAGVRELLDAVSRLPDDLGHRVRSWILATWGAAEAAMLVSEVTAAIGARRPTGDDLLLADTATRSCDPGAYADAWAAALGAPPAVAETATALASSQVPEDWMRSFCWTALLPSAVTTAWASVTAVLGAAYGQPTRAALEKRPRVEAAWGQSPFTAGELQAMPPDAAAVTIAAWRPGSGQPLTGPRELARTLQAVVKADPAAWAATPLQTAIRLREPVYLSHYMRAIAEAESLDGVPQGELADLILLACAQPWQPTAIGDPTYDYDPDWREAKSAAIDLITALARADLGFAGNDDAIWALLGREVLDRSQPTSAPGTGTLIEVINRPCTHALQAVFALMAHEHRRAGTTRDAALNLLDQALAVGGSDGEHYRAVIAPQAALLRRLAPDWVEQRRSQLFGDSAPDGLGQATIDLALSQGFLDPWLMENYQPQVKDAVQRNVDQALECYLAAMLREVPGYTVDGTVRFLRPLARLSDAGQALGQLAASQGATAGHVALATQFWEKVIRLGAQENLAGFAWYANVPGMDDSTWSRLARQTVTLTRGHTDWAHRVAERAAQQEPTPDTLEILNHLVRGTPDYWEQRIILDIAITAIAEATPSQAGTPEYRRLHTALLERGADLTSPAAEEGVRAADGQGQGPE